MEVFIHIDAHTHGYIYVNLYACMQVLILSKILTTTQNDDDDGGVGVHWICKTGVFLVWRQGDHFMYIYIYICKQVKMIVKSYKIFY